MTGRSNTLETNPGAKVIVRYSSCPLDRNFLACAFETQTVNAAHVHALEASLPFRPLNRCRNGDFSELVRMYCRYQHYYCGCAVSNLGLRDGVPVLRITMALRRRRRLVGRRLHHHLANPPPCVAKLNLGKLSVWMRWACILLRSGVPWEW